MATYNSNGEKLNMPYYNCMDYGVRPNSADNTAAMQALIDLIYEKGGGVIWIPVGVYTFDSETSAGLVCSSADALIDLRSRVSIIGESTTGSVFRVIGNTKEGATLFWQSDSGSGEILTGCTYSNFTVDMQEASLTTYSHRGKAFFCGGIKNCVFRDLRLLGTPSTSLGIDMLDNVVMDSIYVYKGGRQWSYGGNGGAGIGIGTGKWADENYIIRNCVCVECGHFGIFLEDQGIFAAPKVQNYPSGQIIANNVIRNGRHYGIGVRGGRNVVITGNNMYENVGGIYADYGAKNILISNNVIQGCAEIGVHFGNEDETVNAVEASIPCENVIVTANAIIENATGIKKATAPLNSTISNNVMIGNTTDVA